MTLKQNKRYRVPERRRGHKRPLKENRGPVMPPPPLEKGRYSEGEWGTHIYFRWVIYPNTHTHTHTHTHFGISSSSPLEDRTRRGDRRVGA